LSGRVFEEGILVQQEWYTTAPVAGLMLVLGMHMLGRSIVRFFYFESLGRSLSASRDVYQRQQHAWQSGRYERHEVNDEYFDNWKIAEKNLKSEFDGGAGFSVLLGLPLAFFGTAFIIKDNAWLALTISIIAGLVAAGIGFARNHDYRTKKIEEELQRIARGNTPQGRMIVATVMALAVMGLKVRTGLESRVMAGDEKAVKEFECLISEVAKRGQLDMLHAKVKEIAGIMSRARSPS
jgi:hypothetical protein